MIFRRSDVSCSIPRRRCKRDSVGARHVHWTTVIVRRQWSNAFSLSSPQRYPRSSDQTTHCASVVRCPPEDLRRRMIANYATVFDTCCPRHCRNKRTLRTQGGAKSGPFSKTCNSICIWWSRKENVQYICSRTGVSNLVKITLKYFF